MLTSSSSSSSTMDSSDDDDRENMRRILPLRPWLRSDPFEKYNDQEFKMRFSKEACRSILDLIENNLTYLSYRNDPISPMLQLCTNCIAFLCHRYFSNVRWRLFLRFKSFNVSNNS